MEALSKSKIEEELEQLEGWHFENDQIGKSFKFNNFKKALGFIVQVGFEAESQAHHPEITNVYNQVSVKLNTHDAGGKVTQKDLDLAAAIDKITI